MGWCLLFAFTFSRSDDTGDTIRDACWLCICYLFAFYATPLHCALPNTHYSSPFAVRCCCCIVMHALHFVDTTLLLYAFPLPPRRSVFCRVHYSITWCITIVPLTLPTRFVRYCCDRFVPFYVVYSMGDALFRFCLLLIRFLVRYVTRWFLFVLFYVTSFVPTCFSTPCIVYIFPFPCSLMHGVLIIDHFARSVYSLFFHWCLPFWCISFCLFSTSARCCNRSTLLRTDVCSLPFIVIYRARYFCWYVHYTDVTVVDCSRLGTFHFLLYISTCLMCSVVAPFLFLIAFVSNCCCFHCLILRCITHSYFTWWWYRCRWVRLHYTTV